MSAMIETTPAQGARRRIGRAMSQRAGEISPLCGAAQQHRRPALRPLVAACAMIACAWQSAHAADATPIAQQPPSATPTASPDETGTTLPNILVVGDTQHLPQSFDQRYASTQVLTREDLDRLSPADPSITEALATLPGVTVAQSGGPGTLQSVSIRGSSPEQVAVFIDGIRIGSATTGTPE